MFWVVWTICLVSWCACLRTLDQAATDAAYAHHKILRILDKAIAASKEPYRHDR